MSQDSGSSLPPPALIPPPQGMDVYAWTSVTTPPPPRAVNSAWDLAPLTTGHAARGRHTVRAQLSHHGEPACRPEGSGAPSPPGLGSGRPPACPWRGSCLRLAGCHGKSQVPGQVLGSFCPTAPKFGAVTGLSWLRTRKDHSVQRPQLVALIRDGSGRSRGLTYCATPPPLGFSFLVGNATEAP